MNTKDIIKHVKDSIIRGHLAPGQKIVEARLCLDLGVGRGKVREALMHLEKEEFVRRIPNASAVVKEVSQKDIAQIYDLLGVLEGLSVRIAARTLTEKQVRKIESFVLNMERHQKDKFKMAGYNFKFHEYMTELGGNTRLVSFVNLIRAQAGRMGLHSFYNPLQVRSSLVEHRRILNAIQDRNPEKAEKHIRQHYLSAKNRLIRYINNTL
jgi:DNA-binding GntR family transcriptional regulator